jgi:hypothetical protein
VKREAVGFFRIRAWGEVNREVVGFRRIQRWEASRKVGRLQDPVAGGGES